MYHVVVFGSHGGKAVVLNLKVTKQGITHIQVEKSWLNQ